MADITEELETLIITTHGYEIKSAILSALEKLYEERKDDEDGS